MSERAKLSKVSPPGVRNKLSRLLWAAVEGTLYRWSPTLFHGWRRQILRLFGARVGAGFHSYPTARIWAPWNLEAGSNACLGPRVVCYNVVRVTLGADAVVSQGAHLCAASHDFRDPAFPLVTGEIRIAAGAWVAADAFVGPGVTIGTRAVVGARAVVVKDVAAATVVAGNPARVVSRR
ncbi:putative colanic acid biosynthesis acetyltransferase [Aquabacter spiritensis]|uniref:Putative colanic acid biosynthesis acetyltransferase WcaF n=1 Tax=Aquabacter spiritensis TaxID=933073 RepID=A0A4V2UXM0_9HYPH|nr:putative colanic acid biosynthesis acetyltransferase [Aquabacter spiritensis]TCT03968.1 putative colanic acid biosynthesis acetyltransferase WcaF [Aquabacter spiritensis]